MLYFLRAIKYNIQMSQLLSTNLNYLENLLLNIIRNDFTPFYEACKLDPTLPNVLLYTYTTTEPEKLRKQDASMQKLVLETLIKAGANINSVMDLTTGETVLIRSCRLGDHKFVRLLLANEKIDINIKSPQYGTALNIASKCGAEKGNQEKYFYTTRILLEHHIRNQEYNSKNPEKTPKQTFDLEERSPEVNATPISCTSASGDIQSLRLLLKCNANLDALDSQGCNPLHTALIYERTEVVEELLKHRSNLVNTSTNHPNDPEQNVKPLSLVLYKATNNTTGLKKISPTNTKLIETILKYNPDEEIYNSEDRTKDLVFCAIHSGNKEVVLMLLNHLKKTGKVIKDLYGANQIFPVLLAIFLNLPDILDLFLQENVNILYRGGAAISPITAAMINSKMLKKVVSIVASYKNDLSHQIFTEGLLYAVEHAPYAIPTLLNYVDVDSNIDGSTAINIAVFNKRADVIAELLKYKPKINYQWLIANMDNKSINILQEFMKHSEYAPEILKLTVLTKGNENFKKLCSAITDNSVFESVATDIFYLAANQYNSLGNEDQKKVKKNLTTLSNKISKNTLRQMLLLAETITQGESIVDKTKYEDELEKEQDALLQNLLYTLIEKGNLECFKQILEKLSEYDINSKNADSETLLEYALAYNQPEIVKYIINIPTFNIFSIEPEILIEIFKSISPTDDQEDDASKEIFETLKHYLTEQVNGTTLLHHAARLKDTVFFEKICDFVDIDTRDSDKNTPLHIASKNKSTDLIDVLIKCGADAGAINTKNQTPNEYAEKTQASPNTPHQSKPQAVTPPTQKAAQTHSEALVSYKLVDTNGKIYEVSRESLIKVTNQSSQYSWLHADIQDAALKKKFCAAADHKAQRFYNCTGIKFLQNNIVECKILGKGGDTRLLGYTHKMTLCTEKTSGTKQTTNHSEITVHDFIYVTTHKDLPRDMANMQQFVSRVTEEEARHEHIELFNPGAFLIGGLNLHIDQHN